MFFLVWDFIEGRVGTLCDLEESRSLILKLRPVLSLGGHEHGNPNNRQKLLWVTDNVFLSFVYIFRDTHLYIRHYIFLDIISSRHRLPCNRYYLYKI